MFPTKPYDDALRALLAAVPDALLALDPEGTIVGANDQAARLFGWSGETLVGRPLDAILPAYRLLASAETDDPNPTAPKPLTTDGEVAARRKDGSRFPADVTVSTVRGSHDLPRRFVLVRELASRVDAVTEPNEPTAAAHRQEEIRRLDSLGQLACGLAHDFNNLLGVVLMYNALLARRISDPAIAADLAQVRAATEQAVDLTRSLLTFAGRGVSSPTVVDVNDVLTRISPAIKDCLGDSVNLELDLVPGELTGYVDDGQFERVVLSLATNARTAMVGGGTLTIATARAGDQVTISVIDTGQGMERAVVTRAFEPFFTTRPGGLGVGLGLAVVYGLVQQNGGEITIESTPDIGTTVTVTLSAEPRAEGR